MKEVKVETINPCKCGNQYIYVAPRIDSTNLCDKDTVRCDCGNTGLIETDGESAIIVWDS